MAAPVPEPELASLVAATKEMAMKRYVQLTLLAFMVLFGAAYSFAAVSLSPSTAYTVELAKVNSDGTTTLVSSTSVTSDANSKITFTFSNVPTQATNNFVIVTVKDAAGAVVTKSFSPAPPANGTNSLGVNSTSTSQATLMEQLGVAVGTDDPIVVSFALMFTRVPNMNATDIGYFAIIGQEAIVNGMEVYLLANGVTTTQLATFKSKIVYNSTAGTQDLRAFSTLFKAAIDTPASADENMAKASGLISSIFVDAAAASGIDLDLILTAFDSAGIKLESGAGLSAMNALSAAFRNSMNQSVNSFFTRLSAVKVKKRYKEALTTLNATTAEVARFQAGVNTMMTTMAAVDTTYALYFDGTTGYDLTETINVAHAAGRVDKTLNPIAAGITALALDPAVSTIQNAIDYSFQSSFTAFSVAIQSTNGEVTALKTAFAAALGIAVGNLPTGFGTFMDFSGSTVNWPIPQTASVNFIATVILAGGSLTYTRSGLAIPTNMAEWFGSCSNNTFWNRTDCQNNGATWTSVSSTFNTGNVSFDSLLGIQEDIMLAENTRYQIFDGGGNPTQAQMQAAKAAFITNMGTIIGNIGGTTDGTTAFTVIQKKSLVKAQQQPSLH